MQISKQLLQIINLKDLVEKFNIPFTCISADGLNLRRA